MQQSIIYRDERIAWPVFSRVPAGSFIYADGRSVDRPSVARLTAWQRCRLCWRSARGKAVFYGCFSSYSIFLFSIERQSCRTKLLILACCIALTGVYAGLRQLPARSSVSDTAPNQPHLNRTVLMLRALGDYGQLMVWPANLHMERTIIESGEAQDSARWRDAIPIKYLAFVGLLCGGVLLYGAFRPGPARGIRILGASWFLLAYLPTSNLVELNATVAEHWLYLPSIGFFVFVVGCALELPRWAGSWRW